MVSLFYINYKIDWDPMSQYRHDYPPKMSDGTGANMDSVTLRRSHFKLGDDVNRYKTSSMEQSEGIENHKMYDGSLDQTAKNELRRSHFVLGNFEPNYNTEFRREYVNKSSSLPRDKVDFFNIERKLRSQNFEFGTDKPDYLSETAAKYIIPPRIENNKQNVSTAMLQQSHYVFGNNNVPWNTTHRREFTPKKADNQRQVKDLTRTNFVLGDDRPTMKSVNEEVFIRHPIQPNLLDKKLLNDLRSHHFEFGKDDVPNQHVTENQIAYQNPNLFRDKGQYKPLLDNQLLRETHWSMGDKSQELPDMYNSTYNRAHTPKKTDTNIIKNPNTFKSSFNINGNGPMVYQTDYRANYVPLSNKIDPKEKKQIDDVIKIIKNSHFNLGDMKNDYNTVMSSSYKFNPNEAQNAKGVLDRQLLNDLRSTHYKLGDDNIVKQTTQRRDYVPYNVKLSRANKPLLQNSHFNLGDQNKNKFEGETIYMSDYIPKELPADENECWC